MQTPNANIYDSNLGGLDGDTSIYVDRNWKTFVKADLEAISSNPLQKLMLIIKILLTGSYLDQWNMLEGMLLIWYPDTFNLSAAPQEENPVCLVEE